MVRAHEFGDDAGDAPSQAVAIEADGLPREFNLEIDVDVDWFRFIAMPGISYTATVTRAGLFDTGEKRFDRDGLAERGKTNTLRAAAASISWTHNGPAEACFVSAEGMLQFSTGRYAIAVSSGWTDSDADGLHDPWETARFGNMDQTGSGDRDGDGQSNLNEYLTGTDPATNSSCLLITAIAQESGGTLVRWDAVAAGRYEVQKITGSPRGAAWSSIATNRQEGAVVREHLDAGTGGATQGLYRVRYIF